MKTLRADFTYIRKVGSSDHTTKLSIPIDLLGPREWGLERKLSLESFWEGFYLYATRSVLQNNFDWEIISQI